MFLAEVVKSDQMMRSDCQTAFLGGREPQTNAEYATVNGCVSLRSAVANGERLFLVIGLAAGVGISWLIFRK